MSDIVETPNGVVRGKKILGMPRIVFILGLGTILGIGWWYYNKRKGVSLIAPTPANGAAMPAGTANPNAAGSGGFPAGASSGGGNPGFPSGVSTYASDAQWAAAGANYLVAQGVPAIDASNALNNLVNGFPLTGAQQDLVNKVEAAIGVAPQGVIGTNSTPGTPYAQPTVSYVRYLNGKIAQKLSDGTIIPLNDFATYLSLGSPRYVQLDENPPASLSQTPVQQTAISALQATGPGAGNVLYRVQAGDSLLSISQRYYGSPSSWQTIYNANRDIIGGDPNVLNLNEILKIPNAS